MTTQIRTAGFYSLTRSLLAHAQQRREKVDLFIIGGLVVAGDVTPDLIRDAVGHLSVRGFIRGPEDVRAALRGKMS